MLGWLTKYFLKKTALNVNTRCRVIDESNLIPNPDDTEELAEAEGKLRQVFRTNLAEYCQVDGHDSYDERVFEISSLEALRQRIKNPEASLEFSHNPQLRQKAQEILTKINEVYEELCSNKDD